MITIDDVLTGHNFPDGTYWRRVMREHIDSDMMRSCPRVEAEARGRAVLMQSVDGMNRTLATSYPDKYPDSYIANVRAWLRENGR